jgi:hypothetical protein
MKLNQVIALVGGRKTSVREVITAIHHQWNETRLMGVCRTYAPRNEDGDRLPPESKVVQVRVNDELETVRKILAEFWDLVSIQECSNTVAKGDIVVDGQVLATVPVGVLLFLEKQLIDLHTLAANLPTLPTDKTWRQDIDNRCYVSEPEQTIRTKKEMRPIVLAEATEHHPAQVQLAGEDIQVGTWTTVHHSGAIPASVKFAMLQRIETLRDAVKVAREQANGIEAAGPSIGTKLLSYIFGM